ncbi:hypothetical protein [Marinisporobacter balticus]|uniref:Uncharacterized protein n=1 Tax=Marinisporobacter balticus TaxID=2018667 RepID=A0A4R2KPG2_9FIRM|nr:hypothetical protein [Marinisporobacter balticus]TCO68485.1 hypothetical protein EV214_1446 [Marinisporobacter balticus]
MFFIGVIFLMMGAILVYGTKYIIKIFNMNSPVILKLIGFFIGAIGCFMIMYGDFPKWLVFIREYLKEYLKKRGVLV